MILPFFILFLYCAVEPRPSLADSINDSRTKVNGKRTNGLEYIFHNVYNGGLSPSKEQELLTRIKAIEQKLTAIESLRGEVIDNQSVS